MTKKHRFFNGYCPTQEVEYEVEIIYSHVPIMGNKIIEHKKHKFYCDYADEHDCNFVNNCPIYEKAPMVLKDL